jgi:hypothetical protein
MHSEIVTARDQLAQTLDGAKDPAKAPAAVKTCLQIAWRDVVAIIVKHDAVMAQPVLRVTAMAQPVLRDTAK